MKRFILAMTVIALAIRGTLHAQLAITETMSSASIPPGPPLMVQDPGFWKPSNVGPVPIDLTAAIALPEPPAFAAAGLVVAALMIFRRRI